jgi:hypothetical protein
MKADLIRSMTGAFEGRPVGDHFVDANKMIDPGSGKQPEVDNLLVTRFTCHVGIAVLPRPLPGVRPGGRPSFLCEQERRQRNRPCYMALRVRCGAQVCRAAPNSLRYAAFKQGARSQSLKSLRDARQTLRSSPMQKGNPGIPSRLAAYRLDR